MDVFLAGFPLRGARVAVAGAGEAAEAKARLFDGSPADLRRIAPDEAGRAQSYDGVSLAFVAVTGAAAVQARAAARAAGALVNVVDRPDLCDFTTPALVDRGAVVGAIATGGSAPLLAAELRRELEALWPAGLGGVAALIAELQPEARAAFPEVALRRAWLRRLLDGPVPALALRGETKAALALARAGLADRGRQGRLSLLVPPPTPDLLSLRALQALGRADRIVVAPGVAAELTAMARRDAAVNALAETDPAAVAAEVGAGGSVVLVGPDASFRNYPPAERLPVAVEAPSGTGDQA